MAIRKILDLSTGHLKEDTRVDLGTGVEVGVRYTEHEHGWIFFLGDHIPIINEYPELRKVLEHGLQQDCMFVNFDGDADAIDELEYFNDDAPEADITEGR